MTGLSPTAQARVETDRAALQLEMERDEASRKLSQAHSGERPPLLGVQRARAQSPGVARSKSAEKPKKGGGLFACCAGGGAAADDRPAGTRRAGSAGRQGMVAAALHAAAMQSEIQQAAASTAASLAMELAAQQQRGLLALTGSAKRAGGAGGGGRGGFRRVAGATKDMKVAVAICAYAGAGQQGALSFGKGAVLQILDDSDQHWWKARMLLPAGGGGGGGGAAAAAGAANAEGWGPQNYVNIERLQPAAAGGAARKAPDLGAAAAAATAACRASGAAAVAGPALTAEQQRKKLMERNHVLHEFWTTEKRYLDDLQRLDRLFYKPLAADIRISGSELSSVFNHSIDMIRSISETICSELKTTTGVEHAKTALEPVQAAPLVAIFQKLREMFRVYHVYSGVYTESVRRVNVLAKKAPDTLRQCTINAKQPIVSLLIKPIQRLPRYELLATELLKRTPEGHGDHAAAVEFERMFKDICEGLQRSMADQKKQRRVTSIFLRLQEGNGSQGGRPKEVVAAGQSFAAGLVLPHRRVVKEQPITCPPSRRREFCHSDAPPSSFSRRLNRDQEEAQQNDRTLADGCRLRVGRAGGVGDLAGDDGREAAQAGRRLPGAAETPVVSRPFPCLCRRLKHAGVSERFSSSSPPARAVQRPAAAREAVRAEAGVDGGAHAVLEPHRPQADAAVGETVILMPPPVFIPIETLTEGTGGCHQMTVSPTARSGRVSAVQMNNNPFVLFPELVERCFFKGS